MEKKQDRVWVIAYGCPKGSVVKFDNFKDADDYATKMNLNKSKILHSVTFNEDAVHVYCNSIGLNPNEFI